MGEIMFNYTVNNTSVKHETMFKYWYSMSKEQSFAYQRFVALSDASTFNKPVAITKVATGFIDLHQLFVAQDGHSMLIQKQNWIRTNHSMIPQLSSDVFGQDIDLLKIPFSDDKFCSRPRLGINNSLADKFCSRPRLGINNPLADKLYTKPRVGMMDFENNLFGNYGDIIVNAERNHLFGDYGDIVVNAEKYLTGEITKWILNKWNPIYAKDKFVKVANVTHQDMMSYRYMAQPNFFFSAMASRIPRQRIVNFIKDAFADKIGALSNFYKDAYGYIQNKTANINRDIDASISEKKNSVNNILHAFKPMPYTDTFEYYCIESHDKSVYKYRKIFASKDDPKAEYGIVYNAAKYDMQAQTDEENSVSKDIPRIYKGNTLFTSTGENNGGMIPEILVFTFSKISSYLSLDSFGVTPNRILNIVDSSSVSSGDDTASYFPGWLSSQYENNNASAIGHMFASDNEKRLFSVNTFLGSADGGHAGGFMPDSFLKASDGGHTGSFIPYSFFISDYGRKIRNFYLKDLTAHKFNANFERIPSSVPVDKERIGMHIMHDEDNVMIQKERISMTIDDDSMYKNVWIHKQGREIPTPYKDNWINKSPVDIRNSHIDSFVYKVPYFAGVQSSITDFELKQKYTAIFNQGVDIIKKYFLVSVDDDIDFVIKSALDVSFYGTSGYDALIIPVSKVKKQSFIDRIDEMVGKEAKPVYITHQSFASVIAKPLGFPGLDLFCDKQPHESYINYKNIFITKNKVRSIIFDDNFTSKMGKDLSTYTQPYHLCKERIPVFTTKDFLSKKIGKDIFTLADTALVQLPHKAYVYNTFFMDKIPTLCYYSYGHLIGKEKYETVIQQQDIIHKISEDMNIFDLTAAIRPIRELYRNDVFHAEVLRESFNPVYNEIESIYATHRELKMLPNDFGNWAWVYEDPDPFDVEYGIDELLLPERDTRYEDFKDIIFDKKRMRPKNPVKKIDDTTFIGKYPTKHPIPNYDDVGIVYLDVRTDIMHEVFLKFYRIWQSKLFEFSTMTMTQSVNKMLEYLYSWIMLYFPEDKIEEALRVFRQIRWYGEMAIIQSSQYIISYEYEDLKSNLHTGTCSIPNDIDPDADGNILNPTMFVDAKNAVIRNNPEYIGISDARVRFTVNVKRNTTFSFSLINTVGSVNIYIDNVLVGTESFSKLNLTYPLKYTGEPTVIDIVKTKQCNVNDMFCIGNIIFANGTFKDLSIEFDPMLKAGNKPLDEIAKKMIQYANEHDDVTVAYEHILKTNVGVSETYKKMLEYWELHHKDKIKGKRLTIKQV